MVFNFTEDQTRGSGLRRPQCGNQVLLTGHRLQWLFISSYLVRAWWVLWETWPRRHSHAQEHPRSCPACVFSGLSECAWWGVGAVVCSQEGDDNHKDHHRGPAGPQVLFWQLCTHLFIYFSLQLRDEGTVAAFARSQRKETKPGKVKELVQGCRARKW